MAISSECGNEVVWCTTAADAWLNPQVTYNHSSLHVRPGLISSSSPRCDSLRVVQWMSTVLAVQSVEQARFVAVCHQPRFIPIIFLAMPSSLKV